ncbi:MAG TPA: homoserine dehydrogenase [Clostridia bacterium]|nr:homoserine dehydrogenase [Clostridia bacterium]
MSVVNVGLLGFGVVGSSVAELLDENRENIERRAGSRVKIKRILVRDLERYRLKYPERRDLFTCDPEDIIGDPEITVIIELMGGLEPASNYITRALRKGKRVVTANKEVMSVDGERVFRAAEEGNTEVYFEGSVGGGIPIIKPLKQSLAANRITEIKGILNGTSNYILSNMSLEGLEFDECLRKAQSLGYAEADPTADISGLDSARKLAILASIGFGARFTPRDVFCEGIDGVAKEDIIYGKEFGWTLKLIGLARLDGDAVELRVHPTFLPDTAPLASISGVTNAVSVKGHAVGEVMFSGPGAGGMATASAVISDLIEVVRDQLAGINNLGCTCYRSLKVKPSEDICTEYYIRLEVHDKPGVMAQVAGVMGTNNISLRWVLQKRNIGENAEIVFVTHRAREGNLRTALSEIKKLPSLVRIGNVIRVENG